MQNRIFKPMSFELEASFQHVGPIFVCWGPLGGPWGVGGPGGVVGQHQMASRMMTKTLSGVYTYIKYLYIYIYIYSPSSPNPSSDLPVHDIRAVA